MRQPKINETYQKIHDLGFTLDATTSNKNKGMLHLLKDGYRIHSEPFLSNGRGTTRVRATLPTSYRHGHTGTAMVALLEWIEGFKFVPTPGISDPFIDQYNSTIETFAPVAFSKVKEAVKCNPKLSFEQLFRIWSVEIQYMLKTHQKEWRMS